MQLYRTVITQTRKDKKKVYCLHKPPAACIAKGKAAKPGEVIYDRGGRGKKMIDGVKITNQSKYAATDSRNRKRRLRRQFPRRADIEAIISHLKSDHRMVQNYLHRPDSPEVNAMLAAAGWNMKKWMERMTRPGEAFCRLLEKWTVAIVSNHLKWAS